jgi:uncharacterized membrane protein
MDVLLLIAAAFAIGFASGLRAFTPLALGCWVALWGWMPLGGTRLHFLGTDLGAIIVSILAVAELIGDKLPIAPNRITAGPLGARVVTGVLAGTAVAIGAGQPWLIGFGSGAIGAVIGAFVGFRVRQFLVTRFRVKDFLVAIAEDLFTIVLALGVFGCIF